MGRTIYSTSDPGNYMNLATAVAPLISVLFKNHMTDGNTIENFSQSHLTCLRPSQISHSGWIAAFHDVSRHSARMIVGRCSRSGYNSAPAIDKNGWLHLKGRYHLTPRELTFTLAYLYERPGGWKDRW